MIMTTTGSNIGVLAVYLVVREPMIPKIMPIIIPPKVITKNDNVPITISIGSIFSLPIAENAANSRYKTFSN